MPDSDSPSRSGRDSVTRMLVVATAVSLVCSVLVASAAVLLKPRQEYNEQINRQRNILDVAGLLDDSVSIEEAFAGVESRVVELETGRTSDVLEPGFDPVAAARDPALSVAIPDQLDLANIGRRARYGTVYFVRDGKDLRYIILPVYGAGLWSQIHGFIALESDTNTIAGITFHQHGETPGLGGEIDNPRWRALWRGKLVYGEGGEPAIEVIKGKVQSGDAYSGATGSSARYKVDGLSGATLTGDAVNDILHYWLGEHGYLPLLQRIWKRGGKV